ncbi:T9SS type B sorting domain-containing protein [uncultured Algibacter sp.]|uniref:T9SS type B sorting domain-containing protein n=1 Tax=uncultured Algibacter sp. TaxID=298659 RepID=UPI0026228350|nr:T9SS type B sorting domain-containing protein [uncultured Algibacter sp.]
MTKTTYVSKGLVLLLLLLSLPLFAQNYVPFTPRFNQDLKGDIQLIGNNILGPDNNAFNDGTVYNHNVEMVYIDIDGDATTFNSSSADLTIPNPGCYRIIHAGLYWGAVTEGAEPFTNVKFRGPTGGYNDIVGTVIFDAAGTSVDGGDSFPYACYADVTSIVTSLASDLGTYTVANVSSLQGETANFTPYNGTGNSAGWSLYIVYEDPTLPGKSITSFDGFSAISVPGGNTALDIPVSGFRTIPAPAPVRANFAFATLEGDSPILGDQLLLNGLNLSTADRPATNFFNSSVTQLSALPVTNRNPNSTNTLGFDTGVIVVPNPANSVIANDATSATVRLETSGDTYFPYFFSLAVDIIEPNIVLTKIVEDAAGNDIGGMLVNLGDELNYVLGFQNTGNDDATNLIIRDILPTNIVFNYPADVGLLPAGVTVQSYNPTTRELVFSVDNSVVEENDPVQEIRFKVTVVSTCSLLTDACSNIISNQAFSTYNGTLNPTFTISDDPSFNTNTGCLLTPGATNFLADIDCVFEEEVILCGASTVLTSGSGYDSYSWSTSPTGTPVIGTTQSITVTSTGTYYVENTAIAPCQSTSQVFEVITFGAGVTNPVIPFADQVVICPNDGKELPNIFLCGGNGPRLIETNITDTTSIIWEQLDETSCTAVTNLDCANEDAACTWNEVTTGPNFMADTAGQFRLTLNYDGGCFNQFYFNVYTNLLVPTVTSRDIYCTTPGEIVIGSVPSGYEFSIDGVNYQNSNVFSVNTAGIYSVYIKQIGVDPNPCIFTVPDVQIRQTDFTVSTIVTQPLCYGDLGSVSIAANDVRPQYYFSISQGGTLVNNVGPINPNSYTFSNLNPGTYTIDVSTEDGCVHSEDIDIVEPDLLEATSALTTPLTCTDGEITIYPTGGTPPYFYFVNGATAFQTIPTIPVSSPGIFNIVVVDSNNCSAETSITVDAIPAPEFTVNATDIACSDTGDVGVITFNVTNPNGNTLEYSIDNGSTFSNSNVFTGLANGTYDVVVQYSSGPSVCITAPQSVSIITLASVTGTATLTTPYSCISDGIITVSGVTGGTAPYTYSLDGVNFQSGTTFTGLTEGAYTVTIRDSSGCAFIAAPIIIDALNPPTDMDFSSTTLSCPAITSDVTITGTTGGAAPLEYQIIAPSGAATVYQASNIFIGLSPDTYTFQVRDANGCVYSETYTIAPLPPITVNTVITKDLDCTASSDGIITGTILGGIAPFTYAVSFNGSAYSGSNAVAGTSFTHTATTDGTYQFQITDANGCIAESALQTINAPVLVTASEVLTNPTCNGYSDGSITLTALTGQAPFTYSLDGGTTFVSSNVFGGLIAGNYNYVIRDSRSCEVAGTVSLANPLPIDVTINRNPVQCIANANAPGSLDITVDSGGVAPFVYSLYDNTYTQVGASVTTVSTTHTFSGLSFGDYYVTIVDSNGCEYRSDAQRIETPPSISLVSNVTTGSCATGATVDISVVSGAGPFTYSIFGQPATIFGPTVSTTHTFTGLNHGVTYQFQVIDSGGCFSIIEVTTPILSAIDIDAVTTTDVSCNGDNDGTVNFTVLNYDASVTSIYYEVQDELTNTPIIPAQNGTFTGLTGASVSGSISGLPAGNYTLFVREADGTLCTTSELFEIIQPIQPLVSAVTSEINANCNVGAQVTITATGGTGPYQYASGAPGFVPVLADFGTNNVLNLDYAIRMNWDIVVRDVNGCEIRINETIDLDPEPIIDALLNNQCTIAEGDFEIDVTLTTAGIAPYTYSIDGGAFQTRTAPFTVSNLSSGTHTIEVQDANGCGNLVSVDIEAPLEIVPTLTALSTCNNDDGEITITGSGGTGTYAYTITPNPASISLTGNVFSGVPPGTYSVTITDTVTTCFENVTVVIPEAVPPTFTTTPTAVTCFGDNNGSFELNVNDYSGAYTYEVFDSLSVSVFGVVNANTSTNPELVTGLLAGTYSVVITEIASPFCSSTSSVIIPSPSEALDLTALETSNVTCDDDKGTITATATGGWGTYEYELTGTATVTYSSNGTFTNLSAGTYTVNVRDAGGCIDSETITLNLPTPIDASISAIPTLLSCFGDTNASITVSAVTGGEGTNYSYTLNMLTPTVSASGPQTSPTFDDLGAGTYNVVVSDGYNCEFTTANVVINQPTEVEASLVKATSQTCTTQTTLTLSATGGTGAYEYSDTASFTTILGTFATSATFSVTIGNYAYYVRDANGCSSIVSNEITNAPLPTLTVSLDTTNAVINCAGDDNGVIIASAEGGLGSYVYTLQDTSGNPITPVTQDSPGVFTNLPVGNYQVQVDSGDCLEVSAVAPIINAASPLDVSFNPIDVTCNGENDGMLEITTSGGSGTIKYAISPQLDQFFDVETVENLAPGIYDIVVQDELGCYVTYNFEIEQPDPLGFTYTVISEAPCDGDSIGEFTIEIFGGEAPYSVSLDDVTYTPLPLGTTIYTFSGLEGGEKMVYVLDSGNCGGDSPFSVPLQDPVILEPLANVDYECINDLTNNTNTVTNRVTVTIDSSIVDTSVLEYSLDGGTFATGTGIYENLTPGPHSIAVRHPNGCVQITDNGIPFEIDTFQILALAIDDGGLNEIVAVATGGAEPYEFRLNGQSYGDENTFLIFESGDYTVTVIDANGCEVSATRFFEYVDVCIPNYFTPNGDGNLDGWGPGCANQYKNLTFDIFDRYGRKIATLRIGDKWDGKYKGIELPSGDYWYVVKLNESRDDREFVGHFTLYR